MKTIALFGPKPKDLCGYEQDKYNLFVTQLEEILEKEIDGETTFITDGTQGFGQLAFWAVNRLKKRHNNIKNNVAIAYDNFETKWRFTGLFSQKEYRQMLNLADDISQINLGKIPKDITETKNLFAKSWSNSIMKADLIIALYPNNYWYLPNQGDTADAMRYASNKFKPIIQIIPDTTSGKLTIKDTIIFRPN